MNKKEAIQLLNNEGWSKEDAKRALAHIDFKVNSNVDELTIRIAASLFAGSELIERQRSQAIQKGLVTKAKNNIAKYVAQIEQLKQSKKEILVDSNSNLEKQLQKLIQQNQELTKANDILKKDNRDLKNIVDAIKLKFTIETKHLLQLESNEIKQGLVKFLKSTLG